MQSVHVRVSSHVFWAPVLLYKVNSSAGVTQEEDNNKIPSFSTFPPGALAFSFDSRIVQQPLPLLLCVLETSKLRIFQLTPERLEPTT